MNITVIGGGNIGGAIVKGLLQGNRFKAKDITIIDINRESLKALAACNPDLQTALGDYRSVQTADIIVLAVKPWLIKNVIADIKSEMDFSKQILISVAAGISFEEISRHLQTDGSKSPLPALFRAIPNTAIAVRQSITLVASQNANPQQEELVLSIFNELGVSMLLNEDKIAAGTALTSCGIAYMFRFVRAAMLAGVELGFYPEQAQQMVVETMLGAARLLSETQNNPEVEIDKVTTPGGITIKGINELEANGFTHAVIQAIKASKV